MRPSKLLIPLLLTLLLILFLPAVIAGKDKKDQKKRFKSPDDLVVAFVHGEQLVRFHHWSVGDGHLAYPAMRIAERERSEPELRFRSLVVDREDTLMRYALSQDRRWVAVRYKKGPLEVTNLETGETVLSLTEKLSRSFDFHPTEDRFLIFQPKVGITQWDLERGVRVEPTLSAAMVGVTFFEIAPSGNYLRTEGRCEADKWSYDYCIFDLRDGSTVAWADDLNDLGRLRVDEKDQALAADYQDLLAATGFISESQREDAEAERIPGCRRLGDGRLFCCDPATVVLTDDSLPPAEPESESPRRGALGLLGIPSLQSAPQAFPGRFLWKIAASRERKKLFINSCDLSTDQRWVVLGVNSEEVLLFSTDQLETVGLALMGSWQQPVLTGSYVFQ